jgi:nucleotide-binding universal stress UspA family protein
MASPIICCTDGSDTALRAIEEGLALLGPDAGPVVVVTVSPSPDPTLVTGAGMAGGTLSSEEFDRELRLLHEDSMRLVTEAAAALGRDGVEVRVADGDPGPVICAIADELGAAGIVIGSRGRGGVRRAVLGSVSDHVVRNAPCPVVVVGPNVD